jgi:membrane-associated protease RseP (regulator of RpoE activity)
VILSEPPQTQYDLNFRLLGIPVRVHPLFWLVALLLGVRGNQEALPMLIWIGVVFVSILVHELGHALTARWYGWEPHITLHSFGGLASYRPTYRSPQAQILITLAGPGAGFLFAALVVGLIAASGHRPTPGWPDVILPVVFERYKSQAMNLLLVDLLYVNTFWGLVNLLPIYPLDGGQIAQEVFGIVNPRDGLRQSLWLSVIVAAVAGVLAYARLHDLFLAIFLGYMAYASYMTLQAYFGPGGGLGGFR